jgi:hypothetical protein
VAWFLLLTMVIGLIVALARQSWIVLFLVGAVLLPIGIIGLVLSGEAFWMAAGETFLGLIVMQVAYVACGWALEARLRRARHIAGHDKPPP